MSKKRTDSPSIEARGRLQRAAKLLARTGRLIMCTEAGAHVYIAQDGDRLTLVGETLRIETGVHYLQFGPEWNIADPDSGGAW